MLFEAMEDVEATSLMLLKTLLVNVPPPLQLSPLVRLARAIGEPEASVTVWMHHLSRISAWVQSSFL